MKAKKLSTLVEIPVAVGEVHQARTMGTLVPRLPHDEPPADGGRHRKPPSGGGVTGTGGGDNN